MRVTRSGPAQLRNRPSIARSTRPVFVALTQCRVILLRPGPPPSGWADPTRRVLVEAFRPGWGRAGGGRLRLRRLAASGRLIRIRLDEEWCGQAALIAARLPSATPFTMLD